MLQYLCLSSCEYYLVSVCFYELLGNIMRHVMV